MTRGIPHNHRWFPVAVQALLVLAESEEACSSSTIAQELKAHAVFLRRILAQLARANLIQAREGRDGGYRLARPAELITLAEVYQAVTTAEATEQAEDNRMDIRVQTCLEEIGGEAEQSILTVLGQYTIALLQTRIAQCPRSAKRTHLPLS